MADKPHPEDAADRYSEEETDRRMEATVRAMIGMKPKPHTAPTLKNIRLPARFANAREASV